MARKQFKMEDNFDEIQQKVQDAPKWALNEIGRNLVKEIRPQINRKNFKAGHNFMRATLQFWARKQEGDLIIGYKDPQRIGFLKGKQADFGQYEWKYDGVQDPIKPVVMKNISQIQRLTGEYVMSKNPPKTIFRQEDTQP